MNFFECFCYFIQNFLPRAEYERNSRLNFFSLFLSLSQPVSNKNNATKRFFKFSSFFAIFSQNFLPRAEYERNSGLKFFSLFFGLSFFEFFCYFIQNFLPRTEYERHSGLKFFYMFFGVSRPVLAKNNAEKGFFNFLNFFLSFSEFSKPISSRFR